MPLSTGYRVGLYEVVHLLGVGGMGEVYRARDTQLKREVAIKVLPESLATDPERLARFRREAEVLASLNHPNIAQIYGVVEGGSAVHALVMELVDGPTLADRIAQGAIPTDEALAIARQIAEALQAAHDQGVIHRDLKPANIKVRDDGTVKVLDFGLAKLAEPASGATHGLDASLSPTITSPALVTGGGVLIGTAAYMSPEQAKGRHADKRSDMWAFGCVLYELLTGQRAFDGANVAETLASVLKDEPDWTRLPADVPAPIRVLLRRSLERNPRGRWPDAAASVLLIDERDRFSGERTAGSSRPARVRLAWPLAAALVLAALSVAAAAWRAMDAGPGRAIRSSVLLPDGILRATNERAFAVTPDGRELWFLNDDGSRLLARSLEQYESRVVLERDGLLGLFLSPDGAWAGIADDANTLLKVPLSGGGLSQVAATDGGLRGAVWLPDGRIVFATSNTATGLQVVDAGGGTVSQLTGPDTAKGEADHYWPEPLSGEAGNVLFTIVSDRDGNSIAVLNVDTGERTVVLDQAKGLPLRAQHAKYLDTGHLLFTSEGIVYAVGFDARKRTAVGTPAPIRQISARGGTRGLHAGADGTLLYVHAPEGEATNTRTLVWVDESGGEEIVHPAARAYGVPRISPSGRRIVFHQGELGGDLDVWTLDVERSVFEQVTTTPGRDSEPIWSPDETRIAYFSGSEPGGSGIFIRRADGTGDVQRLTTGTHLPQGWSRDGTIMFIDFELGVISTSTAVALRRVSLTDGSVSTVFPNGVARLSPDGRWMATVERDEIYVRPVSDPLSNRVRITTAGGREPLWSRDGKTLYFRRNTLVFAVDTSTPDPSRWGPPRQLFDRPFHMAPGPTTYDVAPDGRLLMLKGSGELLEFRGAEVRMIQNWDEDLKRLVPVN